MLQAVESPSSLLGHRPNAVSNFLATEMQAPVDPVAYGEVVS